MAATPLKEGAKAPAFALPRDGGGSVSLADFKGKQARPLLLPAGRHPRLHPGIDRILQAAGRLLPRPEPK